MLRLVPGQHSELTCGARACAEFIDNFCVQGFCPQGLNCRHGHFDSSGRLITQEGLSYFAGQPTAAAPLSQLASSLKTEDSLASPPVRRHVSVCYGRVPLISSQGIINQWAATVQRLACFSVVRDAALQKQLRTVAVRATRQLSFPEHVWCKYVKRRCEAVCLRHVPSCGSEKPTAGQSSSTLCRALPAVRGGIPSRLRDSWRDEPTTL